MDNNATRKKGFVAFHDIPKIGMSYERMYTWLADGVIYYGMIAQNELESAPILWGNVDIHSAEFGKYLIATGMEEGMKEAMTVLARQYNVIGTRFLLWPGEESWALLQERELK